MSRASKVSVIDPTYPKVPVTIGEKTYNLCFDLGALAAAEQAINAELFKVYAAELAKWNAGDKLGSLPRAPEPVNVLIALPTLNLHNTRMIFPAALRTWHPEIGFAEAQRMLTLSTVYGVANAIQDAWAASTPEPETGKDENPPVPGE